MRTYEDIHIMVLRNDVKGLIDAASDADETIRLEAVKALKALNPPEARQVLLNALGDPSANVRRAAYDHGHNDFSQSERKEMFSQSSEHFFNASMSDVPNFSNETKERIDPLRWLWMLFRTWGIFSLIFSVMIVAALYYGSEFKDSGQIFGILATGIPGIVLLWLALMKLKKRREK
jgi:hypothetical protein